MSEQKPHHLVAYLGSRLRAETDAVEVTYDGLFGGEPDKYRRFVPGCTRYYQDDVEITEQEYRALLAATPSGDAGAHDVGG